MKKSNCILMMMVLIVLTSILSGCGGKTKSKAEIRKDLSADPDFYSTQNVTISDIDIIKRKTDKQDKSDCVYVSVKAQNDRIECRLSYVMYYCLYNEGWMLEDVVPYEKENWEITPLTGPSQDQADSEMNNHYLTYAYMREESDLANRRFMYYYHAVGEYNNGTQESNVEIVFDFDESTAAWNVTDRISSDLKTTWNLEGDWYANDITFTYKRMKITEVGPNTIHVLVYDSYTDYIYFDGDVILTDEGVSFDFPLSANSSNSIYVSISVDNISFSCVGFSSDYSRR